MDRLLAILRAPPQRLLLAEHAFCLLVVLYIARTTSLRNLLGALLRSVRSAPFIKRQVQQELKKQIDTATAPLKVSGNGGGRRANESVRWCLPSGGTCAGPLTALGSAFFFRFSFVFFLFVHFVACLCTTSHQSARPIYLFALSTPIFAEEHRSRVRTAAGQRRPGRSYGGAHETNPPQRTSIQHWQGVWWHVRCELSARNRGVFVSVFFFSLFFFFFFFFFFSLISSVDDCFFAATRTAKHRITSNERRMRSFPTRMACFRRSFPVCCASSWKLWRSPRVF